MDHYACRWKVWLLEFNRDRKLIRKCNNLIVILKAASRMGRADEENRQIYAIRRGTLKLLTPSAVHNSTVQHTPQTYDDRSRSFQGKPKHTVARRVDRNYSEGILDISFTFQRTSSKLTEQMDDMIDEVFRNRFIERSEENRCS